MADPPDTRDPAMRHRDLLREIAAGTVVAIPAVTAWGMLAPATIRSGLLAVEDTSGKTGPGFFLWPGLLVFIGFAVGVLGAIIVLERRRLTFGPRRSWTAVVLLASATVIGYYVALGAAFSWAAIYTLGEGRFVWVGIPAGVAQWVVAWLGAFGVVFLIGHAMTRIILSTRATREAGIGEYRRDHERVI